MKTLLLLTMMFAHTSHIASAQEASLSSGPSVGGDCPAFDPKHVSGPDKGTSACPMCKYGNQQGIMIWMNSDAWDNMAQACARLEAEIEKKGLKRMRVFLVYMNPEELLKEDVEKLLSAFADQHRLKKLAVTYIPKPTDQKTAGLYTINPDKAVRNTVIVYKNRGVFEKFINFNADDTTMQKLIVAVERAEETKSF
jgi:protocatechuate 3,4-dioxygenase, beta subunit